MRLSLEVVEINGSFAVKERENEKEQQIHRSCGKLDPGLERCQVSQWSLVSKLR